MMDKRFILPIILTLAGSIVLLGQPYNSPQEKPIVAPVVQTPEGRNVAPPQVSTPAAKPETSGANPAEAGKGKNRKYTVVPGDCLSGIAGKFLGDLSKYPEIIALNKSRYPSIESNPNLILPGWELELPGGGGDGDGGFETYSEPVAGTVQVGTSLNIRSDPWGTILGSFHDGDSLEIVGKDGDWYKIKHGDGFAYVHSNYVSTKDKPAGQTPVRNPSGQSAENAPAVTDGNGRLGGPPCSPMPSHVSSPYGWRTIFGSREFHDAIDIPIPNGTRLNAVGDGVVTATGNQPGGGGIYVKIRYDNGYESVFCHLSNYSVKSGDRVNMGQEIGRSDNTGRSTGPHLHFSMRKNGVAVNPYSVPGLTLP